MCQVGTVVVVVVLKSLYKLFHSKNFGRRRQEDLKL